MNYFEYHIGDYIKSTAHLSMLEDASYRRLIDAYYTRESALPADRAACCRLARAHSKDERKAVDTVLDEFFALGIDGWHQKRCDEEIARFREKSLKAKASADARWANSECERNANALRTHDERNATCARPSNQKPETNNQSSKEKTNTPARRAIPLPEDFRVSDRVRQWANEKGHDRLEDRLEHFIGYARANAKRYADWDQAFMNAIRDDWAKLQPLRVGPSSKTASALMSLEGLKNEPTRIQHRDGERPSEVAGFIPAKHASG